MHVNLSNYSIRYGFDYACLNFHHIAHPFNVLSFLQVDIMVSTPVKAPPSTSQNA